MRRTLMLIDSHAHLEMPPFDRDRDQVVRRAKEAGVEIIVTVGTTVEDCRKALELTRRYPGVYAAIGIHPHEAKEIRDGTYDSIREMARHEKVVAYGEIGLDFFRNLSPRATQIRRFGEQLELASELDLPIVIHDREAHSETVDLLKGWKGSRRGIIHCFSGDYAMAKQCIGLGFYISIPGTVTFEKNEKLRSIVRDLPLESLLVETDCPYLTPNPFRGRRNEPAYVVHTARKVAEIKGKPFEEVAAVTTANAKRIFDIP
ncbi:MAG TPA: TatD family hydrolase [Syntrophales bacterium]|nr:TatD family hydrolase [Syntrophales bacterium]